MLAPPPSYFSVATVLIPQDTSQLSLSERQGFFLVCLFFVCLFLFVCLFFFYNERLSTMTICPNHHAKIGIVSTRSCSTSGLVSSHGKEKESGQKSGRGPGKSGSKVILRETGSFVKDGSDEFYIRHGVN